MTSREYNEQCQAPSGQPQPSTAQPSASVSSNVAAPAALQQSLGVLVQELAVAAPPAPSDVAAVNGLVTEQAQEEDELEEALIRVLQEFAAEDAAELLAAGESSS